MEAYYPNTKIERLAYALGITSDDADTLLADYWENVFAPEGEEFVLDACNFRIKLGGAATFYRCKKCGKTTPHNVKGLCASVKCKGELVAFEPLSELEGNLYANLYRSTQMKPIYIEEHTAQLSRDQQTRYQQAFVGKRINALNCSTTFEMGVDVGSLETVFMRDVPPRPANYVQRAGRAGRALHSAAFVLTYAKLSSHDFTYFNEPSAMIEGKIKAPVFEIENEKVIYHHIFAVAISRFLASNADVYDGDNQTVLLNEGGYERLKQYLAQQPADVRRLLEKSIPKSAHRLLGSDGFEWLDKLIGDDGVLEIAVLDFRENIQEMEKNINACRRANDLEGAGEWIRSLRRYRCGKSDNCGKKNLIDFLVRNNVLPKYGFPVDTVELLPDASATGKSEALQLARDLQLAIAEYAPGAEVVADGQMYISRYIRKQPGKNAHNGWKFGSYCDKCPHCGQPNFTKDPNVGGRECVSCHRMIRKSYWRKTLEPRRGFYAKKIPVPFPCVDRSGIIKPMTIILGIRTATPSSSIPLR